MEEFIKTLKFKSFEKVAPAIKKKFPEATDKEIRAVLKNQPKDSFVPRKQQKLLMIKIFSNSPGSWFHDIFENPKGSSPRYFHLFIGTNHRYGVAHPMKDKNSKTVLESYRKFDNQYKPFKLTSDQDASLLSEECIKYLKSKDITIQSIPDQNHSALGIIDRFIRTLRDLHNSRSFSEADMQELIELYNNTPHSSIKCSPKEMLNNADLEEKYILKCLDAKAQQESRNNFKLKEGSFVRYI
jgi:hypothetical protein